MIRQFTWIIWLFLGLLLNALPSAQDNLFVNRPTIEPAERSITLKPGTSFSIKCLSDYPITWKPFKGFTGIYQVKDEVVKIGLGYASTIELINISYCYVGPFFCVTNETQSDYDYSDRISTHGPHSQRGSKNGLTTINSIYVYVDDDQHLLVHRETPETYVVENRFLVLTCKPSSKETQLQLYSCANKKVAHLFDPEVGFVIHFRSITQIYGKSYTCRPDNKAGSNDEIIFKVTYHAPVIKSNRLTVKEGEQMTLDCSINILEGETYTINWKWPNKNVSLTEHRVTIETTETATGRIKSDSRIGASKITINKFDVKDEGYFECEVIDRLMNRLTDSIFINIWKKGDNSIELYGVNNNVNSWEQTADLRVNYKGNPPPTLVWYNNFDRKIYGSFKYQISTDDASTVLKIKDLSAVDAGNYTLQATNPVESKQIKFELWTTDFPKPIIEQIRQTHSGWLQIGDNATFSCNSTGYPLPTISWTFTPCKAKLRWLHCDEERRIKIEDQHIQTTITSTVAVTSVVNVEATQIGKIECYAVNTAGIRRSEAYLKIVSNQAIFRITGPSKDTKIVAGDNVTIICEASADSYWGVYFHESDHRSTKFIEHCDTEDLRRIRMTWTGIEMKDSGKYECNATHMLGGLNRTVVTIEVQEPQTPQIESVKEETVEVMLGASFRLYCNNVAGLPVPDISWYRRDELIENNTRFSADRQSLDVQNSELEDDGEFRCVAKNRLGSATKVFKLKITNMYTWIAGVAVLVLVLIICTVYSFARFRRIRRELEAAGLLNFETGNLDSINPDLPLHEQANLLPYNKKYEFPRKQLKLGKQLGAGAFGVVLEGLATGLMPHEENTKVAVKMLKETASSEEIRALVTELKIMANLGQHLNIVNLLGAVTKNYAKRELMVIVEYCRFGNLHSVLMKHRKSFIDQINTANDRIDPTVTARVLINSDDSGYEYNSISQASYQYSNSEVDSGNTETSFISSTSGQRLVENQSHYHPTAVTYIHPRKFITTSDLVCWLFQVARGMKYLSSKKVLHGDLAARNVLLSDGNVVKICDFGLARSLYKSDVYKKEGDAPLPLKWLAIESLCDRVFSSFSDVWSFGILMWELFSLGATPYPGKNPSEDLIVKLKNGYRMGKPKNATQEIYDIMLHCWNLRPESRPLFSTLEYRLSKILERGVAEHYIDLNEQYVEMNANNFNQGQTDYLMLMGPPEDIAPTTPYPDPGYLPMNAVFNVRDISVSNPGYVASGQIGQRRTFN